MEIKVNKGVRFKFTRTAEGVVRLKVPESSGSYTRHLWASLCEQIALLLMSKGDELTLRGDVTDMTKGMSLYSGKHKTPKYYVCFDPLVLEKYRGNI